ncbi:MAG: 4-alpha-glucanotransferase [Tepidisphaeraceae bacterium]
MGRVNASAQRASSAVDLSARDSSALEWAPSSQRRASGVLLHVTSLPGRFGIGDLGPAARRWVELLAESHQAWWQMLPLTPTGAGHSPYTAFSAFAGNPLLISLEDLAEDGLLDPADLQPPRFPRDRVDYERVIPSKTALLSKAADRFFSRRRMRDAYATFCDLHAGWLDDYALFMAVREVQQERPWASWPCDLRCHQPAAVKAAHRELAAPIARHRVLQFFFDRQLQRLRAHARERHVGLIGDLPIFVSAESSDAWGRAHLFQLGDDHQPRAVAGVPPDLFAAAGQRWGNPLYDWSAMRQDGYAWWVQRLAAMLRQCDVVRLDHFRGFAAFWRSPAACPDARGGRWQKGPGAALFRAFEKALGTLPLIAEDLGVITPAVERLRDQFDLPGMRVMQFGFGDTPANPHLPHNYIANCVTYPGTHDNDTTRGWFAALGNAERRRVLDYLGNDIAAAEAPWELIRQTWASVARWSIAPMQDVLALDSQARMNTPGTDRGNWRWRLGSFNAAGPALQRLGDLTRTFGRASQG